MSWVSMALVIWFLYDFAINMIIDASNLLRILGF